MTKCVECSSSNVKSKGYRKHGSTGVLAYECKACGTLFNLPYEKQSVKESNVEQFEKTTEQLDVIRQGASFVITSATAGCEVNYTFLQSLLNYTESNAAKLLVLPVKSNKGRSFAKELQPYLIYNNFEIAKQVNVLGALQLSSTLENPLAGLDPISRGANLIVGHPQVALKTMPVQNRQYPPIITTTGSITTNDYNVSKQGYKANFNHSFAAVVVQIDVEGDLFIRHLNFDGLGFYDLGHYYAYRGDNRTGIKETTYWSPGNPIQVVDALVTGDEHIMFADQNVAKATYLNGDSIVNWLQPKNIIRHDVLDSYSVSHHHRGNVFTQYAKWKSGFNSIQRELDEAVEYLNATTPDYSKTWIIASNHNDHLVRWLKEADPKQEPWNAKLYHKLMYRMLEETDMSPNGVEYPDPFELYASAKLKENIKFLKRGENFKLHNIQMSAHGDVGTNGARGSRKQFSILPEKYIIGHSHSPGIEKSTYQVGTSSNLNLEYNVGASSWHHCHCLVYTNGKRQLIFIVNGKWRPKNNK